MITTRFTYEIKLNHEPLQATLGALVVKKLQEPLDEGALHIPITVYDYEYEMLGNLYIKIIDSVTDKYKEFTYLVTKDDVKVQSSDGLFSHNLTVIEYSYINTTKLIRTLTFTRNKKKNYKALFYTNEVQPPNSTGTGIKPLYWVAPLEINQYYEENKTNIFKQLDKAMFYTTGSSQFDVYIRTYDNENITLQNNRYYIGSGIFHEEYLLSTGDTEVVFNKSGMWAIEYGIKFVQTVEGQEVITYYPVRTYNTIVLAKENNTLYDYIDRIRSVVPLETKQYHEQTRMFNLDSELVERFKNVKMPQLFLTMQTLKQTLDTMFKYINAISRVHFVANDLDKLSIDEFNKIIGSFELGNLTDFETSQDIQGYGTKMIAWLENSLQENFRENPSIKNPPNFYKTVRAKNVQLINAENGFILPLEKKIYFPTKVEIVLADFPYGCFDNANPQVTTVPRFSLDITSRFLNIQEWELKNITNDFPSYIVKDLSSQFVGLRDSKPSNLFWEQGKDFIDFSKEFGTWFSDTILIYTVKEALNEYFTIYQPKILKEDGSLYGSSGIDGSVVGWIYDKIDRNWIYRNIGFNIEYVTLETPVVKVNRADTSLINKDSEIRLNQSQRIVDFSLAVKNAYGNIQRSGVPNLKFQRVHTSLDELYDVGLRDTSGYVITQVGYELYNDHIIGYYEATKNHNRLSEFMGIDQAFRAFEVPKNNDIYERHDNYEEFIIIDVPSKNRFDEETTLYNNAFIEKAFKYLYSNSLTEEKITYAFIRTDGFLDVYPDKPNDLKAIMASVNGFGGDQVLLFNFGFKSSLIAGNAIYKKGSNYFNEAIIYTDQIGRFEELWFGLGNAYNQTTPFEDITDADEKIFDEMYKYPLIKYPNATFNQSFLVQTGTVVGEDYNPIIYKKDISEVMSSFNYQVSIMPYDYQDYVLGTKFFTANRLVMNQSELDKLYIYLYNDNTKYDVFDNLFIKEDTTLYDYDKVDIIKSGANQNISYSSQNKRIILSKNASPYFYTSWAIGDEEGNLIVACNSNEDGFIIKRRHFRPTITEMGKIANTYYGSGSMQVSVVLTAMGYMSTDYSVDLQDSLIVATSTNLSQFVFPNFDLEDVLLVQSLLRETKSPNFEYDFIDELQVETTVTPIKSSDVGYDFTDTLIVYSATALEQEIDYSTDFVDTLVLESSTNVSQFIFPFDNFTTDTISVTSYIQEEVSKKWTNISATANDGEVTNIGSGACSTQLGILEWLNTNYPPQNYSLGFVIRVLRTTDTETLCFPTYYYYRITT